MEYPQSAGCCGKKTLTVGFLGRTMAGQGAENTYGHPIFHPFHGIPGAWQVVTLAGNGIYGYNMGQSIKQQGMAIHGR